MKRRKRTSSYKRKKRIFLIFIPLVVLAVFITAFIVKQNSDKKTAEKIMASYDDADNEGVVQTLANLSIEKEQKQEKEKEEKEEKPPEAPEGKKVYLTFDDGPSIYTEEILSILEKNDVKATFFVIGKTDDHSKEMYKKIVEEGHTLAMHSYSHDYSLIYSSMKAFKEDFKKIEDLLTDVTGQKPKYYRFPGGSSNTVSKIDMKQCISYLNKKNITYFDWNVINGDAESSKTIPKDTLVKNVMTGVKNYETSVVLMHDANAKGTTVEALPEIIKKIKKQGAYILPIDESTKVVQHVKADSAD